MLLKLRLTILARKLNKFYRNEGVFCNAPKIYTLTLWNKNNIKRILADIENSVELGEDNASLTALYTTLADWREEL